MSSLIALREDEIAEMEAIYMKTGNFSRVARQTQHNIQTVRRYAEKYLWREKREALPDEEKKVDPEDDPRENLVNTEKSLRDTRNLKLCRATQLAVIKRIRNGQIKPTVRDALEAIKIERAIRGEPEGGTKKGISIKAFSLVGYESSKPISGLEIKVEETSAEGDLKGGPEVDADALPSAETLDAVEKELESCVS